MTAGIEKPPVTPEEQMARLDAALDRIQKQRDEEAVSLPASLGLPEKITEGELAGWFYCSPLLIRTHRVLDAWSKLEEFPPETIDAILKHQTAYAELLADLVRIEDGDGYRRPTPAECMARFRDVTAVKAAIARLLRGDGFGSEEKDADPNASGERPITAS